MQLLQSAIQRRTCTARHIAAPDLLAQQLFDVVDQLVQVGGAGIAST
jgi:hypothetical protein